MTIDDDQLAAFSAALSVLGRLQLTPADSGTRVEVLSRAGQWPLLGLLPAGSPAASLNAAGWEQLAASGSAVETEQDVRSDQDRVYGISARAVVPPFESVHRDEEGLVFDQCTLQVRAAYRRLGLQAPRLNREPDDHLGLELDFLGRCCQLALSASEQGDAVLRGRYLELAEDFTREHLLAWAPAVLEQAAAAARTCWLRGLELLTLGTVLAWAEALGLPEPPVGAEGRYTVLRGEQSRP